MITRETNEGGEGFPEAGERVAASGETLLRGDERADGCFGRTGVAVALAEGVPAAEVIVGACR